MTEGGIQWLLHMGANCVGSGWGQCRQDSAFLLGGTFKCLMALFK